MKCTICGERTRVVSTINNTDDFEIYRERKCLGCGRRYFTSEFEVDNDKDFRKLWQKYRLDGPTMRKKRG